jgi:hypothetical protein
MPLTTEADSVDAELKETNRQVTHKVWLRQGSKVKTTKHTRPGSHRGQRKSEMCLTLMYNEPVTFIK